jgi:hypothetical protein
MKTSRLASYYTLLRHRALLVLMAWVYKANPLLAGLFLLGAWLSGFVALMQLLSAAQVLVDSGWPHLPDLGQMAFKGAVYISGLVVATGVAIKLSTWVAHATETLDRSKHEVFFKLLQEHGYRSARGRRVHHWEWALVTATLAPEARAAYRFNCLNHSLPVASPVRIPKERF